MSEEASADRPSVPATEIPGTDDIIAAARSLVPTLRERAAEAARRRCVPAETIADFQRTQLIRIAQPARFGGFEFDWEVHCEVSEILSAADGSQAWIQGIMANHAHMLGTFPLQAQEDVWGRDPSALISASFEPKGRARRTRDGFVLSGTYSFASGIDYADWLICGGFVEDGGRLDGPHFFLVPRADVEVIDDWHTMGLEGTGSKSFHVREAVIPLHRLLDGEQARVGEAAGTRVNSALVYRTPRGGVTATGFAAMCVGMARSVLDEWLAFSGPRRKRTDAAWGQAGNLTTAAEAAVRIDAARELYLGTIRDTMGRLRAGVRADDFELLTARRNVSYCCKLAFEAGTLLFRAAGGSAIFANQRIGQQYRNLMAGSAHFAVAWNVHGPAWASQLIARADAAANELARANQHVEGAAEKLSLHKEESRPHG
jgi:3-hydroxy-9,10-secoandrosta-1,3,5(10)-triene-9,17-dione monooxygenase